MTKDSKSFVLTIKDYIDKNYSDWTVSMNLFTGLVGFSAVYINRAFKEVYGINPIEYLQKVRLEKAKELIELGVPLGKVAYECGYSMRTFYRVFEKDTGMSPGKYKQRSERTYEQFKEIVKRHDLRPLDYARKACDSIMFDHDPTRLPPVADMEWVTRYSYSQGIFLLGMYKVYKLCQKKKYFNYINEWLDFVDAGNGEIRKYKKHPSTGIPRSLDGYQPLRIFMAMYEETGTESYKKIVEKNMKHFGEWETACDGIYLHDLYHLNHGICLNSVYMLCPTACMWGRTAGRDSEWYECITHQPIAMYEKMLNPETGLLYHAWDDRAEWADPLTGLSGEHWGRGIGYYIMGMLDMLDYLPENHKDYGRLCDIAKKTLDAIAKYQDESGRWYQIVDKGDIKENWLENSCSGMFVYSYAKAINMGIIDKEYATVAMRGYSGIIDTIEYGENEEIILKDICEGVLAVGDYIEKKSTMKNDLHGISPFVLMCTEIEKLLNNM